MKRLLFSLLFFLPAVAAQDITINIHGTHKQINFIICSHCGKQLSARDDWFMIIDPYEDEGVHYLCEDCLVVYEEFYNETKEESCGK